ncbi:meiosis regulator and mRNA stability factor 1-like [Macrosteles quadrilineatus]|uniref:meiosis regulator and mRNA stability factor 1-like n=1 Tax=Macrosteles quadrilineatus TaxID=74068 RepID=UPI0023E2E453|nr:meiosis regulator and mRNA stability factor 1-like [Macrosteles quadrilineatus]
MSDRKTLRSRTRGRRPPVSYSCEEDETDTSTASDQNTDHSPTGRQSKVKCKGGYCSDSGTAYNHRRQRLPPIGVFWDIENCQVPRNKSAAGVAQVIREEFFSGYEESEFVVACDANRESQQVVNELNDAQVCVLHVPSQSKNAADEKLRHGMRKFAHTHGSGSAVVLISGDVNFAPDLCDLRHRYKIYVILVHNDSCSESLIMCAHETYRFSNLVANLPMRSNVSTNQPSEVTVSGLPLHHDAGKVRARLKRLAENCGGRVGLVVGTRATVQFSSMEFGIRAQKRMDGEDVFGSQIAVSHPVIVNNPQRSNEQSPIKYFKKPVLNGFKYEDKRVPHVEDQRSFHKPIPPFNNSTNHQSNGVFKKPFPVRNLFNQENVPVNSKFNQPTWERTQSQQNGLPVASSYPGKQNSGSNFPAYEPRTNEGYSNGRHSLDSMLDFDPDREEREKESNATFENWLRNSTSNLDKKVVPVVKVNTTIPPPPIVNLPRRNDKYFFHPIDTMTNGHPVSSPSPASSSDASEPARCWIHSGVQSKDCSLASVTVRLSDFSTRIMALVTSHNNRIPLSSLRDCYEAQFEMMASDSRSVTLEHLVTCVCSVEVVKSSSGKYLRLATNVSPTFSDPPVMEEPLLQLSKDLQNLLKNQPRCQIAFDNVIAVYHKAYGKPCKLSDYGCTKLVQLVDKLSHTIQVLGEKTDRVLTLTHRAQVQRFTSDLSQVLLSTPSGQITVRELPQMWFTTLGRTVEPKDYGLCYLEDLLGFVPANIAVVTGESISLPSTSQRTGEQSRRLELLVTQIIELLSKEANFKMDFAKFCPAYHKHFGTQCKLSDYGFSKLAELFEAIPKTVTIEEDKETGRQVSLTHPERLRVLSGRVKSLVVAKHPPGLYVDGLACEYLFKYGHALRPHNYNCSSVLELVKKLDTVKVLMYGYEKPILVPESAEQGANVKKGKPKSCQPKANQEVKIPGNKTKTNGDVTGSSAALLELLKKAQNCPTGSNGVKSVGLYNQLKPMKAEQGQVMLLSPAEFLRPPTHVKKPMYASIFPSSPDPSTLPTPVGFTLAEASNVGLLDLGVKLLEDIEVTDHNRCMQGAKLAPQFCSPLQLK